MLVCDANLQLPSTEIYLNKEEDTERHQFINFSIREYVAEILKRNPAKCWPYRSLHDTDIISLEDTVELAEAPKLSKAENFNGIRDQPKTEQIADNGSSELTFCKVNNGQNRHKNDTDEGGKIRNNVAADNNDIKGTLPRRKTRKFRLLSDIYNDSASELHAGCDRTNPKNVNKRFATEIEHELDDDDDVTLAAYFRKQKGAETTNLTVKKRRDAIVIAESSVDQDRKSNHGSEDSIGKDSNVGSSRKKSRTDSMDAKITLEHQKDFGLKHSQKSNQFAEVSNNEPTEKENEDSEMEAVMLLARRFNENQQILRELETNTTCACAKKKITKTSSKTADKHPVRKITKGRLEKISSFVQTGSSTPMKATTLVCSFNRNPADFNVPNGENKYMRGG